MTFNVTLATTRHARHVARFLRDADRDEARFFGLDPEQAVMESFIYSKGVLAILHDRTPCGLVGVCHGYNADLVPCGVPWMVGTPLLVSRPIEFFRLSVEMFDQLCWPHDRLYNVIDPRNTLHVRWLQWLGFEFTPGDRGWSFEYVYGRSGAVHRSQRRRSDHVLLRTGSGGQG